MMTPLNSPLEVGIRILVVLSAAYPRALDIATLTLCDYRLLHSAQLGGPSSIHPELPVGPGELGVKRRLVETGIQVMVRAGMVAPDVTEEGISYRATDDAPGFIRVLESKYIDKLQARAHWVAQTLADNIENDAQYVSRLFHAWSVSNSDRTMDEEG